MVMFAGVIDHRRQAPDRIGSDVSLEIAACFSNAIDCFPRVMAMGKLEISGPNSWVPTVLDHVIMFFIPES